MKHQYFGDVNDYVKYGLLRCFSEAGFRIGVCWMLTPEDQSRHGGNTSYLSRPAKWQHHDSYLFSLLLHAATQANAKHLSKIEVPGAIPQALFYNGMVPDLKVERAHWRRRAFAKLGGSDLLFFDPDNGVEVLSKPMGLKNSSKYVYWEEIKEAWGLVDSILVYQHFPRVKRTEYIPFAVREMEAQLDGAIVMPLRSSNVLFLLAYRNANSSRMNMALELIKSRWSHRVWPHVT